MFVPGTLVEDFLAGLPCVSLLFGSGRGESGDAVNR